MLLRRSLIANGALACAGATTLGGWQTLASAASAPQAAPTAPTVPVPLITRVRALQLVHRPGLLGLYHDPAHAEHAQAL